jgi:hypothetical protein
LPLGFCFCGVRDYTERERERERERAPEEWNMVFEEVVV